MPVAPPPPVAPPLPPPAMAPPVMDTPVVGPPPPQPAPKAPIALPIPSIPATPEIPPTRGVDDGGMGGLEEVLPEATGERRRRRQASPDEGSGERREERRSGDSGRRREEAGELGGERAETTGGAEDTGRGTSKEEGRYQFGDRMTEEQKRMAEKFATKDPESMLTSGPDESAEMENIRAIAQGKPADDIASVDGSFVENTSQYDPTPTSVPGVQNPELVAQLPGNQLPPPPPPVVQGTGLGLFGAPSEAAPINMFGSGASPSEMRTEADQFAESNPRIAAMLARMDAPEAPLEKYVPEGKAEGGFLAEMQQDETGVQILEAVAMALQNPQDDDNAQTIQSFQEAFGDEALAEVAQMLQAGAQQEMMAMDQAAMAPPVARQTGGLVPGAGDAMADDKLGVVDQGEPTAYPIKFSSGEFLVAGDVVAGLGSGNTERGAEVLNKLQDDVRVARNGTTQQAPPINLSDVLPGTYGERYG